MILFKFLFNLILIDFSIPINSNSSIFGGLTILYSKLQAVEVSRILLWLQRKMLRILSTGKNKQTSWKLLSFSLQSQFHIMIVHNKVVTIVRIQKSSIVIVHRCCQSQKDSCSSAYKHFPNANFRKQDWVALMSQ